MGLPAPLFILRISESETSCLNLDLAARAIPGTKTTYLLSAFGLRYHTSTSVTYESARSQDLANISHSTMADVLKYVYLLEQQNIIDTPLPHTPTPSPTHAGPGGPKLKNLRQDPGTCRNKGSCLLFWILPVRLRGGFGLHLTMVQVTVQEDPWELTKTRKAIPADLTRTPKVIAAGFSRTATVSFSMAMQVILKGPV